MGTFERHRRALQCACVRFGYARAHAQVANGKLEHQRAVAHRVVWHVCALGGACARERVRLQRGTILCVWCARESARLGGALECKCLRARVNARVRARTPTSAAASDGRRELSNRREGRLARRKIGVGR
eukprot:4137948-Pleurochrysis_carterae.AAC.1